MLSKNELLDTIDELEESPPTFQNIQKLATFYSIYDHLYGCKKSEPVKESIRQTIIDYYGDSEFLTAIEGKDSEQVFMILDELMETVKVLQPRLYEASLQRFTELL